MAMKDFIRIWCQFLGLLMLNHDDPILLFIEIHLIVFRAILIRRYVRCKLSVTQQSALRMEAFAAYNRSLVHSFKHVILSIYTQ